MKKEDVLRNQRISRKANGNLHTRRYEKTRKGFLMRKYRNMTSRVTGVQHLKAHLYKGKEILDREDFYEWAVNSLDFDTLFENWKEGNYDRKLCPTVDRIDASKGYTVENMQWITHSENSRLGALSRYGQC